MKTKIKRHSRSVLSIVLSLCMLISCMMIGIIATDAAINWEDYSNNRHHYLYYDDSVANLSEGGTKNIYVLMDYGSGSNVFQMSRVDSKTLLYRYDYENKWVGCTAMAVKGASSAPESSTRYTSCDRYNTDAGTMNGNAVVYMYGSKTGTTLNVSSWTGNGGDKKQNVKNNVTLATKVDETRSGNYSGTSTTIATLSLSSVYWKENNGNYSVSSLGEATGFNNGSVTYGSAVCAGRIDFAYSSLNSNYDFKGWYDASGNQLTTDSTYSGYQAGHKDDVTYYAYFQKKEVVSSSYSLTGDIWSSCITQINGSANNITRGNETDAQWWGSYHSDAAIGTSTGNAGEYYIDITTADRATLVAGNPTFTTIDIGLYKKNVGQKAFKVGDTYYNYIGGDYKVTSAGLTDADIVDLAASNGGGSLQLQPGRSYRITVNENSSKISVQCTSADKYFLAGQYTGGVAQFFGGTWNTSNNELTYNSTTGCYEKTFTTNIPAGTINFKVVENGDSDGWDSGSWPTDGNQSYVIKANATSVTFSYNPTSHVTTVTQVNSGGGGTTTTGWLYSKTAAADRTEVNPIIGMSAFDASTEGNNQNGKFRFMYGTGDTGLDNAKVPDYFKSGDSSNAYWAELTEKITHGSNFYFGLTNYWNQGNLVGNNSEEINDATYNDGTDIEIKDTSNNPLFKIQRKQNNDVSDSAKYVMIYEIDWDKVSAIGVKAYDNSKSTNNNNSHTGKVDYQIYYKAKGVTPVEEAKVVDIIAKNGTIRDNTFNRFTNLANTDIDTSYFYYDEIVNEQHVEYNSISAYNTAHPNNKITYKQDESYGNSTYAWIKNVPVGAKIKISTELSPNSEVFTGTTKFSDSHYLKAYSFNGMTYKLFKPADGVATTNGKKYTEEWTVRAVNTTYHDANDVLQNATTNGNTVEVTPIYYMQDNTNCKTFYIDGYDGTVQNAWGNMLCVYPYYEGMSNKDNAFGGYPGQPMLFWGGKYQMEIPLTVDGTASGASVKGLTLHNGYWDLLHRSIDIRCNSRNHAQTYDYDDFYKLYKEKNPDTIIFDFKYKTANDNFGDGYNYTNYAFAGTSGSEPTKTAAYYAASGKNGVELVTDYFGRQVDAFGNLIADTNKSDYDATHPQDKELLFVSTGYKDTYVGEYATLWAVYAPQSSIPSGSNDTAGKFIGLISSSELYLNTWDNASKYPVSDHGLLMTDSRFENTYKHLKDYYTGVPALITYEKEIWNDSKDKAYRSDGKWYYSNNSDKISASIKIQYGSYTLLEAPDHSVSSNAWNDDPFDNNQTGVGGEKNIGTNTGCSAYFTNTTPNLNGKVASGEQFADSTKKFTFQAVPSGSYMFAGWVRYSNGKYYEITENEIGESPMSSNDVYIARFVDAQTGSLTIQHVVEQTNTFNGTGTPSLTVTVKDGNGNNVSGSPFTVSDGSKIDISKWIDSHFASYTIDISLTTTPANDESFMKEIVSSSGNFTPTKSTWNPDKTSTNSADADKSAKTTTVEQFTVQSILDSGVTSLRYVSHLMKPLYTYNYEIIYTYNSRFWGEQSYTQTGTCEEGDFTGSKTTAKLTTDFIIGKTPYEKNFRQQIDWNYTTTAVPAASGTGNVGASAMENNVATDQGSNTYKMTAHVYASKTVNDKVTAEFVLPYKYNEKAQGYTVKDTDVYNSSGTKSGTSYLYDSGNESVSLSTKAYSLFTYDDQNHTGSDDIQASSLPLMEAAPYLMTNLGDNDYHYKLTDNIRYYTGNSFKVGDTTYYKSQADVPQNPGTYKVLTASDSVTFTKIKYAGTDHTTTYHFAVEDTSGGAKGEYGYKIYFFSYVRDDDTGAYKDNDGNTVEEPIFNGQYCVYSVGREKDGIIAGTGVKKYFTRWDIFNTKGDFVTSCYSRRFSFSGYDNYVVKPIYESDTEQNYASSAGLDNTTLANITYLGDTRNQWKGDSTAQGQYGTVTGKTDGNTAGDKLIHDFALAYAYNGLEISKVPSSTKIKVGMIIEQLGSLDSAGGTKITDSSYYADKYKSELGADLIRRMTNAIKSGKTAFKLNNKNTVNSKIGNNVDNNWGQKFDSTPAANSPTNKMSFNSVIDNFNRLQWFYTFDNTKTGGVIGNSNNANFAYRAWSYIYVDDTKVTISESPTYFTLYDSASR